MSAARPQFSIDDAFELSLEDAGPGPEPSGVARFGPLHFERRARFEAADEDKQSRLRYQGCWRPSILRPQLPVVLQHHQQRHPTLLQRLLQLDAAPSDPEEPQSSAGLLPAAAAGAGADPGRRGTGGGPLARRLQRHLLRPRLPAAGPGSLPRDLHLLRRARPPRLPVLPPALLREVSLGPAASRPQGAPRPLQPGLLRKPGPSARAMAGAWRAGPPWAALCLSDPPARSRRAGAALIKVLPPGERALSFRPAAPPPRPSPPWSPGPGTPGSARRPAQPDLRAAGCAPWAELGLGFPPGSPEPLPAPHCPALRTAPCPCPPGGGGIGSRPAQGPPLTQAWGLEAAIPVPVRPGALRCTAGPECGPRPQARGWGNGRLDGGCLRHQRLRTLGTDRLRVLKNPNISES